MCMSVCEGIRGRFIEGNKSFLIAEKMFVEQQLALDEDMKNETMSCLKAQKKRELRC